METNESFKLLGLSASDSGTDISDFVVTTPRKKKRRRRHRSSSSVPSLKHISPKPCLCKGKTIALSLAATLLLCWLVIITWLAIMLHGEIRRLDTNVRGVVAGSQGVPDALQKCHSISRELQQNQTALFNRLATLSLQIGNFSTQLGSMQYGLHNLEERLKATPELVNVPQDLKELRANVAVFGSQISDLEATVTSLKDQYSQLQDSSKSLLTNVTTLQDSFTLVLNTSKHPEIVTQENKEEKTSLLNELAQMAANITTVNDTLISKLNWLVEDQQKDHKLMDYLENVSQNVSARVTTLEGECARKTVLADVNTTVKTLAEKLNNGSVLISDLGSRVAQLQNQYGRLEQQLPTKPTNPVPEATLDTHSAMPSIQQSTPSSVQPVEPSAQQ